jgi:hypothetical protein
MLFLKRVFTAPILLLGLLIGGLGNASAGSFDSHITTHNRTDVWAWVTAYVVYGPGISKIQGAWCVGPRSSDRHTVLGEIRELRFEVTKNSGCKHPVLHNEMVFGPGRTMAHTYYVDFTSGRYKINNAPVRAM